MFSTFIESVRGFVSPEKRDNMKKSLFRRPGNDGKPIVFSATRKSSEDEDMKKVLYKTNVTRSCQSYILS